jgi:hypothetical protein
MCEKYPAFYHTCAGDLFKEGKLDGVLLQEPAGLTYFIADDNKNFYIVDFDKDDSTCTVSGNVLLLPAVMLLPA